MSKPKYFTHPDFAHPHIEHAFFSRLGGVSEGDLASLNCGSSFDSKENISENRRLALASLPDTPKALCLLRQTHSDICHTISSAIAPQSLEGDAMVTREPGIALGILTADCTPVLAYDVKAGVIGCAHAGWKGAIGGITEAMLTSMEKLGARKEHIYAIIGPTIRQASYEVGQEFLDRFLAESESNEQFFVPSHRANHYRFNLPGYVKLRLRRGGLKHIHDMGFDTCADEVHFFSYRHTTLAGKKAFGNLLSLIMLKTA